MKHDTAFRMRRNVLERLFQILRMLEQECAIEQIAKAEHITTATVYLYLRRFVDLSDLVLYRFAHDLRMLFWYRYCLAKIDRAYTYRKSGWTSDPRRKRRGPYQAKLAKRRFDRRTERLSARWNRLARKAEEIGSTEGRKPAWFDRLWSPSSFKYAFDRFSELSSGASKVRLSAAEYGRKGGQLGGRARASAMSAQERSLQARRAAKTRWLLKKIKTHIEHEDNLMPLWRDWLRGSGLDAGSAAPLDPAKHMRDYLKAHPDHLQRVLDHCPYCNGRVHGWLDKHKCILCGARPRHTARDFEPMWCDECLEAQAPGRRIDRATCWEHPK